MHRLIFVSTRLLGILCVLCALIPFVFYGILNTGVITLAVFAAGFLFLPGLWPRLSPFPRLRGFIGFLVVAVLLFCAVISMLMLRRGWFHEPPDDGETAVIVLGSKINGDQPSLMLRRRLDVAAAYLGRNPDAICVASGGQGADELYPEGVVMRNYLIRQGIDPARILAEQDSTNTRQNIRFSAAMLDGDERVVIVTDGFHQLRGSVFAAAEGLETDNLSSLTPWGLFPAYWMREILGVSWAWVSIKLGIA